MTHKRTLEDVEELLRGFRPVEPPEHVDARILGSAAVIGRRRVSRLLVVSAGVSALAAVLCFGIFLLTRDPAVTTPPAPPDTRALAVIQDDLVLTVIGGYRNNLYEMREMLELVPSDRENERKAISAKLTKCLERLNKLENRLRRRPGNSYFRRTGQKEVHV